MTDDQFDDDAFRAALGARAGGAVDAGGARAAVVARAGRTRTVRTVALGGATAGLLVVGLTVLATGQGAQAPVATEPTLPTVESTTSNPVLDSTVPPTSIESDAEPTVTVVASPDVDPDDAPSTTTDDVADDSADQPPTSSGETASPGSADSAPPSSSASTGSTPVSTNSTTPSPTPSSTPTSEPDDSVSTTSEPDEPDQPDEPDESSGADAPFTRQYNSAGGSITVSWNGASLSLLSVSPSAGYQAEIDEQSEGRIRVDFNGADGDSRIEVRADDGKVTHSVS